MRFLTEPTAFRQILSEVDGLIAREKRLPDQVFKNPLSHFVFVRSDDLFYASSFFEKLKLFMASAGESRCNLVVLDPEPEGYFFRHFGKYPVIELTAEDTTDSLQQILGSDPGGSPADSVESNSTVVIIYSKLGRWVIYLDRSYELGVVGFIDRKLRERFIATYGHDNVFGIEQAVEDILGPVFCHSGISPEIRDQLLKNYSAHGI